MGNFLEATNTGGIGMVAATSPKNPRNTKRFSGPKTQFEWLEQRVLLSSTLFVTPAASDPTHFHTVQEALAVAVSGDTIVLQSGFAAGSFLSTTLTAAVTAGATTLRTATALSIGEVVSVGKNQNGEVMERELVVGVQDSGTGDFIITLANALQFNHTASVVDATNAGSTGLTIGINKAITFTADPGVVLPWNVEVWSGNVGATLSNLNLTNGAATSLFVDGHGNTFSNITVAGQIVLNAAQNNTFTNVSAGNRLLINAGSFGNTVSSSTLQQLTLMGGAHDNSFLANTIRGLLGNPAAGNNGGNLFQANTFSGILKITGSSTQPTNNAFLGNTFNVLSGNGLTLTAADGTVLRNNTFTCFGNFISALVIANSRNVTVDGNTIKTTGSEGTAVYAYADANKTTSVDITGNTLITTTGWGLYLEKRATSANLETRVQANNLCANAWGAQVAGDGISAGNVDFGGGSTSFGTSLGKNDFSAFLTAGASTFALGLIDTDNAATLLAKNNKFGVTDPMTVVSDSTHAPDAFGTGNVVATAMVVEKLSLTVNNLSVLPSQSTSGVVAHFTSNLSHLPADFLVTINYSDGTTGVGSVVANNSGGFDILAGREWDAAGAFTMSVAVTSNAGGTTSASGNVTVSPESLGLTVNSFSILQTQSTSGVLAHFTAQLSHLPADFTATISWGDGSTSVATVVANASGGYDVVSSRSWNTAGTFAMSIHVTSNAGGDVTNAGSVVVGPEVLTLNAKNLAVVQTGSTSGIVAHFTANLPHMPADFSVVIFYSDGAIGSGTVVASSTGGFDILASRSWNTAGSFSMTVKIMDALGSVAQNTSSVTVTPRQLAATGGSFTVEKQTTFSGTVATFTDNLTGTTAANYSVTISWSDGVITSGTVTKNADGSFSVSTTRTFSGMGAVTGSIAIATTDNLFSTSTSVTGEITNKNGKTPPGKNK